MVEDVAVHDEWECTENWETSDDKVDDDDDEEDDGGRVNGLLSWCFWCMEWRCGTCFCCSSCS